jgi:nicotinamide-nucleotide amidase
MLPSSRSGPERVILARHYPAGEHSTRHHSAWATKPMSTAKSGHDRHVDANPDEEPEANGGTVELGAAIAEALTSSNRTAAAAESLTGGNVSAALSAIKGASDWFLGGVVAYAEQVKFDLLRVERGPVINARSARQMAAGVARLLGADCAVATTGVGGPGPREDLPQGTVFIAVSTPEGESVGEYRFEGDPPDVVRQATRQALRELASALGSLG